MKFGGSKGYSLIGICLRIQGFAGSRHFFRLFLSNTRRILYTRKEEKREENKKTNKNSYSKYVRSETTTLEIAIVDLLYRISSRSQKVGVLDSLDSTRRSHIRDTDRKLM